MKHLFSIYVMFLMFLVGCTNQENSITSPTFPDIDLLTKDSRIKSTLNIKAVLEAPFVTATKLVSVTKEINGVIGGTLSLNENVFNSEQDVVHAYANFKISAGAFIGIRQITMVIDVDNGCISFFPDMSFLRSCSLDYSLQNMNLVNLGFIPSDRTAEFVYFNDNGSIEPITNLGVSLNYNRGYLSVSSAKIDHFSRYGFLR